MLEIMQVLNAFMCIDNKVYVRVSYGQNAFFVFICGGGKKGLVQFTLVMHQLIGKTSEIGLSAMFLQHR